MDKLKAGIIGCGAIARGKHLAALKNIGEVEATAFCDIISERAESCAKDFGKDANVYTDYRELLDKEELDIVYVCTPNRSHSEITVAALEAGTHVMCEKPMSINAAQAKKMVDAAKRTGKMLTIGYQNRFRSDSIYLKKECEKGTLGEIYYAKAHAIRRRAVPTWGVFLNEYEQGGGPLIDIGTHALDLTLWTMDNYEPEYCVGATFKKLNEHGGNSGNAWGNWEVEDFTVEDSAFGFVVMKNGAVISLESSWALNILDVQEGTCTLCGTKAGADMRAGLKINGIKNNCKFTETPVFDKKGVAFIEGTGSGESHEVEARQWINAVINEENPVVLPEQAYVVSAILEGIYKSASSNKTYYFTDL